jgi:hypothetical protein
MRRNARASVWTAKKHNARNTLSEVLEIFVQCYLDEKLLEDDAPKTMAYKDQRPATLLWVLTK